MSINKLPNYLYYISYDFLVGGFITTLDLLLSLLFTLHKATKWPKQRAQAIDIWLVLPLTTSQTLTPRSINADNLTEACVISFILVISIVGSQGNRRNSIVNHARYFRAYARR